MLILTRYPRETIMIGEEVKVTVIAVRGNRVRFAIEAPRNVAILREELLVEEDDKPEPNGNVA